MNTIVLGKKYKVKQFFMGQRLLLRQVEQNALDLIFTGAICEQERKRVILKQMNTARRF
jgi:hypothetical protein